MAAAPPILGIPSEAEASPQQRRPQRAGGRVVVPLTIAGMYSAGDPAAMPDGYTRQTTNMLLRPNRVDSRPPCVYDGLTQITGLMYWDDLTNQQRRFMAIDTISVTPKLYKKATSGETWDSGLSDTVSSGDLILGSSNFLGKLFIATRAAAGQASILYYDGQALHVADWDGKASSERSLLWGNNLATFDNRLYISDAVAAVINLAHLYGIAYDSTFGWTNTNITARNVTTATGQIVSRIFPTSTATQACQMVANEAAYTPSFAASTVDIQFVWRWDMRGTSAQLTAVQDTYRHRAVIPNPIGAPGGAVPVTIEAYIQCTRQNTHGYVVGDIITTGGFRYRCTTLGTSAGAPPAFNTSIGTTTADGTVTWTNEGADTLASIEDTIPSIAEVQTWTTVILSFSLPARTNTVQVYPRLKLWNQLYNALPTLTALDVSLKDGKTDGDPSKQNYGLQMTCGSYTFPFYNQESSQLATVPLSALVWTEINDPTTIRAENTYDPQEIGGRPTGVVACGGRLLLFKRFGYWVLAPTGDPDTPVLPEGPGRVGIGSVSPVAIGTLDDEVFWIGDREIYRLNIGYEPRPICGFAMREEIMAHGSTWVETAGNGDFQNVPRLAVDEANREIWVYTQVGKLYVYHIGDEATPAVFRPYTPEKGQWTTIDLQGREVSSMAYNQQTGKMEIVLSAVGIGSALYLVRLDPTSPLKDVVDNTATQHAATSTIIFKPLELFSQRYDAICEHIQLYHTCSTTQSQSGQTLQAFISLDRGQTYPNSVTVNFDPTKESIRIPIWTMGPSITLKLVMTGAIGPQIFSLSRAEAQLNIKRGEYPRSIATETAGNL